MENNLLNGDFLPHEDEVEKLVLGSIIQGRNALNEVREILSPTCFYNDFHKAIYETILEIDSKGDIADMIVVMNAVKNNKYFNAHEYAIIAASNAFNVYQHALRLQELATRRKFYEIGHYLLSHTSSEEMEVTDVISFARERFDNMLQIQQSSVFTLKDAIEGVYKQIGNNMAEKNRITGHPTGFRQFDEKSGGLQRSDLYIIAAETSMGKTSLAINMAMNSRAKVAFYSMEMQKEQIAARMISIESGVPANQIMFGKLSSFDLSIVDKGVNKISGKPVYFDDRSTSNIDTILSSIRSMKLKYDIDGAVIDYLQILNVNMKGVNKEQQMADVARRLKNLAKELNIWIIALSQLNRDAANPVPSLNRLRDSGQIAEAADVVILIYRPEVYSKQYPDPFTGAKTDGTAMIDIAKGRNIGLLKFLCGFEASTTRFKDLTKIPIDETYEEPF